jgi:hypothetical protein
MSEEWWKERLLENGKLSDLDTKSEYERGFIDCWNGQIKEIDNYRRISKPDFNPWCD